MCVLRSQGQPIDEIELTYERLDIPGDPGPVTVQPVGRDPQPGRPACRSGRHRNCACLVSGASWSAPEWYPVRRTRPAPLSQPDRVGRQYLVQAPHTGDVAKASAVDSWRHQIAAIRRPLNPYLSQQMQHSGDMVAADAVAAARVRRSGWLTPPARGRRGVQPLRAAQVSLAGGGEPR